MDENEAMALDLIDHGERLIGLKGKNALYRAANNGSIPAVKVGGRWVISPLSVKEMYLEIGRLAAAKQFANRQLSPT
jgi:hypothetical protein